MHNFYLNAVLNSHTLCAHAGMTERYLNDNNFITRQLFKDTY